MPVTESIHGLLFSSSKDKKFNPGVLSEMPRVFQGNVPLSGVLLKLDLLVSSEVLYVDQLLALVNFGVPISS